MTRLILTTNDSGAGALMQAGAADIVIPLGFKSSKLALTVLGEAVLAQTADFRRHNRVHRWWGGTKLTSDRMWRWDAADCILIAP